MEEYPLEELIDGAHARRLGQWAEFIRTFPDTPYATYVQFRLSESR